MNNTALGAVSNKKENIRFISEAHEMFFIPKNLGIAGSIGILALDGIIGGLIGGMMVIISIINTVMEIIKINNRNFWT